MLRRNARSATLATLAALLAVVACGTSAGSDSKNAPDAFGDAPPDTSEDALPDAASDAAPDTELDAPSDTVAPTEASAPCTLPDLGLTVATLAGCDIAGADDGPRGTGHFDNPVNVAVGSNGRAYVADFDSSRVRVVDKAGSTTTLVARPDLQRPFGIALAPDGSLYLETDNNDQNQHSITTGTIWHVDTKTGAASVVARNIGRPRGLAVLSDGRVAMADHMHHVVELLTPSTGKVAVLAGTWDQAGHVNATGSAARFAQPYDLVVLPSGALAVSDLENHVIRQVTLAGVVTDYAGSGSAGSKDGPVASATFDQPKGLAVAADGSVYVTDVGNFDVRRIRGGQVVKIAGAEQGWQDNDAPLEAKFYGLEGIDFAADGRLVVADGNGGDDSDFNRVRIIHLSSATIPP